MWATRATRTLRCANSLLQTPLRTRYRTCIKDPGPRCDRMSESPKKHKDDCTKLKRAFEIRKPRLSYVEIWEDPECCRKLTCPDHYVRFDDLYWKPTDKFKRKFMQTWVECPEPKKLPVVCITPQADVCEPERRPRKPRNHMCERWNDIGLMKCQLPQRNACPKVKMPKCRSVAGSLRCKYLRGPSKCKKYCTPYPAFSECQWDAMREKLGDQCKCLIIPVWCEILEEMRKQEQMELLWPKGSEKK